MSKIQIVFDGPPGPEAGRFVEVERDGKGIREDGFEAEWIQREDGYWVLEFDDPSPQMMDETIKQLVMGAHGAHRVHEQEKDRMSAPSVVPDPAVTNIDKLLDDVAEMLQLHMPAVENALAATECTRGLGIPERVDGLEKHRHPHHHRYVDSGAGSRWTGVNESNE